MRIRYSFVIPAYNEEALIGRTIEILRGSASHLKGAFEIVVANDDSNDRTPEIAREKGARVIDVKKRQIAAVRNAGASIATGEILVFVDADTLVPKETLIAMENAFEEKTTVAGGAHMQFDANPRFWGRVGVAIFTFFYFTVARWAAGGFLYARRDAFDKAGVGRTLFRERRNSSQQSAEEDREIQNPTPARHHLRAQIPHETASRTHRLAQIRPPHPLQRLPDPRRFGHVVRRLPREVGGVQPPTVRRTVA
jgi:glycosyltransferase involved in cell wall biosynthesis